MLFLLQCLAHWTNSADAYAAPQPPALQFVSNSTLLVAWSSFIEYSFCLEHAVYFAVFGSLDKQRWCLCCASGRQVWNHQCSSCIWQLVSLSAAACFQQHMINDRVLYMEDICLSCPCYLSLQSLLQLTRFESHCNLLDKLSFCYAWLCNASATCFARSLRVRIKLSGPEVEIYLSHVFAIVDCVMAIFYRILFCLEHAVICQNCGILQRALRELRALRVHSSRCYWNRVGTN